MSFSSSLPLCLPISLATSVTPYFFSVPPAACSSALHSSLFLSANIKYAERFLGFGGTTILEEFGEGGGTEVEVVRVVVGG